MPGSSRLPIFLIISLLIHAAVIFVIRVDNSPLPEPAPLVIPVSMLVKARPPEPSAETPAPEPVITKPAEPESAPLPEPVKQELPRAAEKTPEPVPPAEPRPEAENSPESAESSAASAESETAARSGSAPAVQAENPFADLMRQIDSAKASSYPLTARKKGYEGRVILQISLDADGNLLDVAVYEGCAYEILNEAAVELVKRVLGTPYGHNTGSDVILKMPVTYRLR